MNLTNLAEDKGATEVYLIIDKSNPEMKLYSKVFKVIDAKRVPSAKLQP